MDPVSVTIVDVALVVIAISCVVIAGVLAYEMISDAMNPNSPAGPPQN